jgi:glycosyltransferase involved in cell wall biosynthesis
MTPPFISVILCAYNPRRDYLEATLESLRRQDLPLDAWELIVIDNNSEPPVSGLCDLDWHPAGRFVVEKSQGLAHARRRGYHEARGDLVVHSDDDNVLAPDYLSMARTIATSHPHIGNFGGQLIPRFEVPPRNDLERSFGEERRLESDRWSNLIDDARTMPWGAGMCLRREVIEAYLRQVESDPRRLLLGRTGNRLMTGEDLDLNYVCVESGFGTGLFKALSFEHFIPRKHLSEEHHIRYKGEANGYSVTLLRFLHFGLVKESRRSLGENLRLWLRRHLRTSRFEHRRQQAWDRGVRQAMRDMKSWGWITDQTET